MERRSLPVRAVRGGATAVSVAVVGALLATAHVPAQAGTDRTGGAAPSAVAAPGVVNARPGALAVGPAPNQGRIVDKTLVLGDLRATFTSRVSLLGSVGPFEVVRLADRVVRVAPDGGRKVLVRDLQSDFTLSEDGVRLYGARIGATRTRLTARNSVTGRVTHRASRAGMWRVVAGRDGAVLVASDTATYWWALRTGTFTRVNSGPAWRASIGADRLVTVDDRRCSTVSKLSDPSVVFWTSCTQIPVTFSPYGNTMLTVHIDTDGLGPSRVQWRGIRGVLKATYRSGWFVEVGWDAQTRYAKPVMTSFAGARGAWVRCTVSQCRRTSRFWASDL